MINIILRYTGGRSRSTGYYPGGVVSLDPYQDILLLFSIASYIVLREKKQRTDNDIILRYTGGCSRSTGYYPGGVISLYPYQDI